MVQSPRIANETQRRPGLIYTSSSTCWQTLLLTTLLLGIPQVDNCSYTARLGSRKWAPRFDYILDQQVGFCEGNLGPQRSVRANA